jgi:hypothetical protein
MKSPILGGTYVARSINAANNRMVNLFPEVTPEQGKEAGYLNRAPGLRLLQTIGTGPIRGMWAHETFGNDFYVASGTEFYKLTSLTGTPVKLGDISGTGPVSIADNGYQLFIACNGPSYIYDEQAGTFGPITDVDFPGALTVCFIDGYFVFNEPDSQRIWTTALLNGFDIDALGFASAEGAPDNIQAVWANHRELWVYGSSTIEVWYNAGTPDFAFTRLQGAFAEHGLAATFSVAKLDNGLFWLGADPRGYGVVFRDQGYSGLRISTHAVEFAIQQYPVISDAVGYSYQQSGHAFYVLSFPTANVTWVFDVSSGVWHERAGWDNGHFTRHLSNCQVNFEQTTVVGSYNTGQICALDLDVYEDLGQPQRWLRSWRALPTGTNDLKRTAHHALQLDVEAGVGLNGITQGTNPQVNLRWSDDGGHTWGNYHARSIGKIGEYGKRVIWRRLGMTEKLRDRVYEISGTDPVKIAIMGAELSVTPTHA